MRRPIGYYVHHHGDGHRQRALALAAEDPQRVVLLGTGLAGRTGHLRTIDLPDDRMSAAEAFDGIDGANSRPQAFHYAPLNHDGVRARMSIIARWIAEARPALMVVDVSVEITMLARLCAAPVAFVRLSGRRDDTPHCEAYRAASLLIAPFAVALDDTALPKWVRDKTLYCPGIVKMRPYANKRPNARSVLVVAGHGGDAFDGAALAAAAIATPTFCWRVIGPAQLPNSFPDNITFAGWVDDAMTEVAAAEIVIGAAGDGLLNIVIALEKPFICCPEPRPFNEQVEKASRLAALQAAIVIEQWPHPGHWPTLLTEALAIDRVRLAAIGDPNGAKKTMALLTAFADDQK